MDDAGVDRLRDDIASLEAIIDTAIKNGANATTLQACREILEARREHLAKLESGKLRSRNAS